MGDPVTWALIGLTTASTAITDQGQQQAAKAQKAQHE